MQGKNPVSESPPPPPPQITISQSVHFCKREKFPCHVQSKSNGNTAFVANFPPDPGLNNVDSNTADGMQVLLSHKHVDAAPNELLTRDESKP
jgi:hypothetical protein